MSNEIQAVNRVREQAIKQVKYINDFDYSAPAELFPSRVKKGRYQITYKRFDTAAEAIRFAVEDIAPGALLGAYIEVNEARFGLQEIQHLYASTGFPLKRRATQAAMG